MYPDVAVLALLCFCFSAYAVCVRARARRACAQLESVVRRQSDLLEAARVLTASSRESTTAVLAALDRALRALDCSLDVVLAFVPQGEEIACMYAEGTRAEHFDGLRLRRDGPALPARAASSGHRVELTAESQAVIPTDRAAVAIPMAAEGRLLAVVYAATTRPRIDAVDPLVCAVTQAAAPFALAAEREADRRSATYDGLTGLYTPRAFREKLQEELNAAQLAPHASLALWFVDTDHFKRVNDTLGHATGDMVLGRMAALLRAYLVPQMDLPARNGGDEFCAIVRNVEKLEAIERAQRFCDAVRAADFGIGLPITASVGVAAYPYDAAGAAQLLEVADAAMYHSKRGGRDRVSFATGGGAFAVFS